MIFCLLVAFHTHPYHVSCVNPLPLSRNDLLNSLLLQRHTKTIKESTAVSSKKTPSKQEKDKEVKFSETKNAVTTLKSHPHGDNSKSAAKKTVKNMDAKKPVSSDVASKRSSTDSNTGQRKSVQLSTG